jgi:hypothetical protein
MSESKITGPGEYVTRDGRKATVEFLLPGKEAIFPWIGWIDDPFPGCSTWNGGGMNCSTYPGPNDIVGHWVEPREPAEMWAVLNKDGSIRWTSIHERNAEAHGKELGLLVVKLVEDGTNGGR